MRIATKSASASVSRMLEAIILLSGHSVARNEKDADFMIEDTVHPTQHETDDTPKLMLVEQSAALDQHAVACPLRPERLIQRLAMLGTTQSVALGQGWTLDMLTRTLQHASGTNCPLTEKECSLLKHLTLSHPAPIGRDTLLGEVWGMQGDIDTHTLETHIYRLRAKLEELSPSPGDIITKDGAYALVFGPNLS